jgi:hypothetical protein
VISLNGIGEAAACDLGSNLIPHFLLSMEFLGLLTHVDLHLTDVRTAAKVLITGGFALDRVHRPFDFGDLSIDGGICRSGSSIQLRGCPTFHGSATYPDKDKDHRHNALGQSHTVPPVLIGVSLRDEGPRAPSSPALRCLTRQALGHKYLDLFVEKYAQIY